MSILGLTPLAHAVPNVWTELLKTGGYSVHISTPNNDELSLGCFLPTEENTRSEWMHLSVNYKGKEVVNNEKGTPLSFYIDNSKPFTPNPTNKTHIGSTEWQNFVESIPTAKKIEVYKQNKLIFILTPRNGKAIEFIEVCS